MGFARPPAGFIGDSWDLHSGALRASRTSVVSIPICAQFPELHAERIRKIPLKRDTGRQRAPKYGHLGDLAVRVE
ncbi:MAG: hypothetical protein QOG37_2466, partial [Mycobacterium sp.]|nr:hypothetical protein [Mycobacterium sp.]